VHLSHEELLVSAAQTAGIARPRQASLLDLEPLKVSVLAIASYTLAKYKTSSNGLLIAIRLA
jgi:hypothetical protein